MNSVRVARAALRARPSALKAPLQKRSYADVAPDKIRLSLALPHQVCTGGATEHFRGCKGARDVLRVHMLTVRAVSLQIARRVRPDSAERAFLIRREYTY